MDMREFTQSGVAARLNSLMIRTACIAARLSSRFDQRVTLSS
jgi:hypothetical protein